MRVKIFDLERDHREIRQRIVETFDEVLGQGEYILGSQVRAFEEAFAAYTGSNHAVGVNSGTDAIKIAGLALGLKGGDKVVTTPNTYIASVMGLSVHGIGARLCDIEGEHYNMDPERLEEVLREDDRVRVCIPVHLYGHPCRMDEIMEVCGRYGVKVMEDACQAHGARYRGKRVGSIGEASAFSFYPTKNLGCFGDGGMVVTDSEAVYQRAVMLRSYGQSAKHVHAIEGFNSRLDEVHGAILRFKLDLLDRWNEKRRHAAWLYRKELEGLPLTLPFEADYAYHVYHLFVIATADRDDLMNYLRGQGIDTLIHYPTPIHLQGAYRDLGYGPGSFPNAEKAAREVLSLPIYPSLREEEILYVTQCIREYFRR